MFKELVQSKDTAEALNNVLVFALMVLISTFLLQGLVKHVSVLKPVSSLADAFFLSLALSVIKCC